MKKSLLLMLGLAVLSSLPAAKLADYKPLDKSTQTKVIYSQDFEAAKPPKNFKMPKGFQWKRGFGENGNGGLIFRRPKKTESYKYVSVKMPQLQPGRRYRLEFMLMASEVKNNIGLVDRIKTTFIGFDFTEKGTKKYICSAYPRIKCNKGNIPWTTFQHDFSVPKNSNAELCLFVKKDLTCKEIHWDNIVLRELGDEPPIIYPLSPLHLTLKDNDVLKMRTSCLIPGTGNLRLFAVLPDGRELDAEVKNGEAEFKLDKLEGKGGKITFTLCDDLSKRVLGEMVYPFNFNPVPPAGTVLTDASGRLTVNGKPFFPVGMFLEIPEGTQEKYDHMKRMGVNTVLQYHNFELRLPEKRGKSSLVKLRRSLDIIEKSGLKFCFSLTDLTGRLGHVKEFDGIEGRENILKYIVNGLKDHPAMLGWYVSDENQVTELDPVRDMRFTISKNDPWHPVLTLTNIPRNFEAFGTTGDVMMYDNYPIHDDSTQDIQKIEEGFQMERKDCRLGLWWVPQIFNWAIYPGVYPQSYQEMRWPTEEEMRSQSVLALNYRARGIIFYAYESVGKHDRYVPGDSKKLWPLVEGAVRFTADLEPWFLADKQPVTLKVENKGKSKVAAKLHTANDGRAIVAIVSVGPGTGDAVITLPEGKYGELKSRFGKTKSLGNGKYQFQSMNIASDILE